jgi:hypothetical protein
MDGRERHGSCITGTLHWLIVGMFLVIGTQFDAGVLIRPSFELLSMRHCVRNDVNC